MSVLHSSYFHALDEEYLDIDGTLLVNLIENVELTVILPISTRCDYYRAWENSPTASLPFYPKMQLICNLK